MNDTERQLMEENRVLRQQLEEYRTIFDTMPIMLWYKDDHNRLLRLNDSAANFEGVERHKLEGQRCEDLYPPEMAEAFWQDDKQVLDSGQPKLNIIEPHRTPEGRETWLQTGKVPYRDKAGKIAGVIAFAVDITQQKQLEMDAQAKNRDLQRTQVFIRATLRHLQEAIERGADRVEMLAFLREANAKFSDLLDGKQQEAPNETQA